jgi:hypothetical protein
MKSFLEKKTKFNTNNFKINEFAEFYNFMNNLLQFLKTEFIYNIEITRLKNFNLIEEHPDFDKYFNSIILFHVFHEFGFFDLREFKNNNDINILLRDLFNNWFYEICISSILVKYSLNNLTNQNIKALNENFIEIINNFLYINIDYLKANNNTAKTDIIKSNAILIITLYKEHFHELHEKIKIFLTNENEENLYS